MRWRCARAILCVLVATGAAIGALHAPLATGGWRSPLDRLQELSALTEVGQFLAVEHPTAVAISPEDAAFAGLPASVRAVDPSYVDVGSSWVTLYYCNLLGQRKEAITIRRDESGRCTVTHGPVIW